MKKNADLLNQVLGPLGQLSEEQLQAALDALSERERVVLELRFGIKEGSGVSLQAVGRRFGVTGERIRQIEARAIGKLRRLARARSNHGRDRLARVDTTALARSA